MIERPNTIVTYSHFKGGFGSNFIKVVDWFWYSKNTGVPIYVNWNYNGVNFFNDLFIQKQNITQPVFETESYYLHSELANDLTTEIRYKDIPLYKKYNWSMGFHAALFLDPEFKEAMEYLHNIYQDNLTLNPSLSCIYQIDNTLGVHARMIGHFFLDAKHEQPLHTVISESEFYAKNLKQIQTQFESGNYKNIYLGCDDKQFLDICKNEFKDKIMYQNYERNLYHNCQNRYVNHSVNVMEQRPPISTEFHNALIDILHLAMCKDFIGSISGFTFSTLIINPYSNFTLFNTLNQVAQTG